MLRSLMMAGVIAGLGCVRLATPPPIEALLRCPDPANCTVSNGTGVYFAEGGAASLGPMQLMITHFINGNGGSRVAFQGRYFDAGANRWRLLLEVGSVYRADFRQQTGLGVASVTETDTMPTWTLLDAQQNQIPVTGPDLRDLALYINFGVPVFGQTQYVLTFEGPIDGGNGGGTRTVHPVVRFNLRWRPINSNAAPAIYCRDATGAPDQVVFQRGIAVDPVDGTVTPVANQVTMSCSLGAPATVYRWGYDYVNADLFYFAAGIHMKRASYCGDGRYFTVTGTAIHIDDDHTHDREFRPDQLEAWWTEHGALCANPDHARHGELVRQANFAWRCGGTPLPVCQAPPGTPPAAKYLVDAPAHPMP